MDNFIIGTFRENINLLFHNLHVIQDTIPKKLSHLTDLCDTSYDEIENVWYRIDKIVKIVKDELICE